MKESKVKKVKMSKLLKIFDDLVTIEIESLLNLTAPCCHSILFSTSKTNLMAIYFILFLFGRLSKKNCEILDICQIIGR